MTEVSCHHVVDGKFPITLSSNKASVEYVSSIKVFNLGKWFFYIIILL